MKVAGILLFSALSYLVASVNSTKLTYYWIVHEKEFKAGSDAQLASCDGNTVYTRTSKQFAERIAMEGSGYLKDDKTVLNLSDCISDKNPCKPDGNGKYSCFEKVKYPVGSNDNALVPFVSIATNNKAWPYGTLGTITQLKGKKLPNGEVHNGCVRVDDSCSTCTASDWIDFYVLTKENYNKVDKEWRLSDVTFKKEKCSPKKYNF